MTSHIPLEGSQYYEGTNTHVGIILCHAYTGSPADVNFLARKLNQLGYSILCPLFDGHKSNNIFDLLEASPEIWWQNTKISVEWMKSKFERVLIFGLSMGGVMACRAIADSTLQLDGGGVFNSPIVTSQERLTLTNTFMAYSQTLYKKANRLAQFEQDKQQILERHVQQLASIMQFSTEYHALLHTITVPFYIAQSGEDELINSEDAYELSDMLVNAKVDFHWFPHNTHVITVDRQREAFEDSVIEFIERTVSE